jgi:protein TonB
MAANPGTRLKCIGASVLIHAIFLAALISSVRKTSQKGDVIEVVPMDESSLTLPIEETADIPAKPKRLELAASQPIKPKAVEAAAERNNTKVENRVTRANPVDAAIENGSNQQTRTEIQREGLLPLNVESAPPTTTEPITEGFGSGSGTGMGAGGSSGKGIGGGGDPDGIGGFGNSRPGQGADGGSNLTSFGSPTGPRFLQRKMPEYPFAARRQKKEGMVVLAITIDASGCLKHVEVIEASDPLFIPPSIAALRKSSFLPAVRNGTPITVKAILPIRFALSD